MSIIKLSEADIKICEEFSNKVFSTNIDEYKRRNQNDIPKIKRDIKLGKIAEIGVYKMFTERGISLLKVH